MQQRYYTDQTLGNVLQHHQQSELCTWGFHHSLFLCQFAIAASPSIVVLPILISNLNWEKNQKTQLLGMLMQQTIMPDIAKSFPVSMYKQDVKIKFISMHFTFVLGTVAGVRPLL